MAQNIYDQEAFFKEYSQIPRQIGGLAEAPEWPKLSAMLPDLQGLKLLDLGCGFGWVCRWSREQGAVLVEGIDVSKNMLERAKTFPGPEDNAISYKQADLETLKLPSSTYDVVFSSLAFHYLQNLPALIQQVYQTLTPGGTFVFSVEHPIFTAPRNPEWIKDSEDKDVWPLDQYLNEGPRTTSWFADGVVKQHRTIATYVSLLLDAGFVLSAIDEWGPTYEQIAGGRPDWPRARHRPPFLLVKATKPQL